MSQLESKSKPESKSASLCEIHEEVDGVSIDVKVKAVPEKDARFTAKSECGFVGLWNQGATCYLNSLLQSLFLTTEFRQALFEWKYNEKEHGIEAECIPRQLALLFARLSLSQRGAVSTKDLTHSFRWTTADSFRQHDVQELMRVLFAALESSVPSINALYQGSLVDSIECTRCKTRTEHRDTFLDLSLDIGETATLEAAIDSFVRAETLSGDNKYLCRKCGQKEDALKGLSLAALPNVLTITLKRFVFDFKLLQRVKLHSECKFPETLDMTRFIPKTEQTTPQTTTTQPQSQVFDLLAVLLHSGTAMGGHYYAYIRAPDQKWYEFNDAAVRPMPEWGFTQAFGGSKGGASAYMLVYRRRQPTTAQADSTASTAPSTTTAQRVEVPDDLAKIVAAEDAKYAEERAAWEKEQRMLDLCVVSSGKEHRFRFDMGTVLRAVTQEICTKLGLSDQFAADCVRLRRFAADIGWAEATFDDSKTLQQNGFFRTNHLILETRKPGDAWPVFDPNKIPIRVRLVTAANVASVVELSEFPTATSELICVEVDRNGSLGALRAAVADALKLSASKTRLVRLHEARAELLSSGIDSKTLNELGIGAGQVVYAEESDDERGLQEAKSSRLCTLFESSKCQISISFNNLDCSPDNPFHPNQVFVSKNDTLRALKERISKAIDVPVDEFRTSLNPKAAQFKDDSARLADLQLVNFSYLWISAGRPLRRDEFEIKFFLYDPSASASALRYPFLFQLPFSEHTPIAAIKTQLLGYLAKLNPDGKGGNAFGIKHIRLRSKRLIVSDTVYMDDKTLRESVPRLNDETEMFIQGVEAAEKFTKDHRLVMAQLWDPVTQTTGPLHDLIIRHMCTIGQFRQRVSLLPPNIAPERLAFAKGKTTSKMTKAELMNVRWYNLADESKTLRGEPFNMRTGDLFLFKDASIPVERPKASGVGVGATRPAPKRGAKSGVGAKGRAAGSAAGFGDSEVKVPRRTIPEVALRIGAPPPAAIKPNASAPTLGAQSSSPSPATSSPAAAASSGLALSASAPTLASADGSPVQQQPPQPAQQQQS